VKDRRAAFECVIAIAVPRGPALVYSGRCEGKIAMERSGKGGFGYDPVFFYPPLGKTFAEMGREEKNRVSHRGKAMAELLAELDKVLKWLELRLREEPFWPRLKLGFEPSAASKRLLRAQKKRIARWQGTFHE
jgi:XTP/dITP diphosphohydrolase